MKVYMALDRLTEKIASLKAEIPELDPKTDKTTIQDIKLEFKELLQREEELKKELEELTYGNQ